MNLKFLADADSVTLELEIAKNNLENAKAAFELAKKAHEEMLALAEDEGFTKAKLKKLTEDRLQSLRDSGLLDMSKVAPKEAKPKKPKTKVSKDESDEHDVELDAALNEDLAENGVSIN